MGIRSDIHSAVMQEYDMRHFLSRQELDKRIDEVYNKNPRFSAIDEEIANASVDYVKKRLSDPGTDIPPLASVLADLKEERRGLLESMGYSEDYLTLRYFCKDCHDTGYTGGKRCHCYKELATRYMYQDTNLKNIDASQTFESFTFDYYDDSYTDPVTGKTPLASAKEAYDKALHFVKNFGEGSGNIFIYGDTGVGKTFLLNCIANELINMNSSVIYFTSFELFDSIARYTFRENNPDAIYDHLFECDVLLIDDLGTELVNSFVSSQLFLIVNERILNKRSTIISTNLSVNDIIDNYTERTFSRISMAYDIIKLTGADIRIKKKIH
ncbi:MAG: ATP-binding protein [Lachnospiraceae bacterium]|nr:ATP-binding protein [Lachnospiraceae bacterium]